MRQIASRRIWLSDDVQWKRNWSSSGQASAWCGADAVARVSTWELWQVMKERWRGKGRGGGADEETVGGPAPAPAPVFALRPGPRVRPPPRPPSSPPCSPLNP